MVALRGGGLFLMSEVPVHSLTGKIDFVRVAGRACIGAGSAPAGVLCRQTAAAGPSYMERELN